MSAITPAAALRARSAPPALTWSASAEVRCVPEERRQDRGQTAAIGLVEGSEESPRTSAAISSPACSAFARAGEECSIRRRAPPSGRSGRVPAVASRVSRTPGRSGTSQGRGRVRRRGAPSDGSERVPLHQRDTERSESGVHRAVVAVLGSLDRLSERLQVCLHGATVSTSVHKHVETGPLMTTTLALDLAVTEAGDPDARLALVLHGGGGPRPSAPIVAHLASTFHVLAPTHPAGTHGPSRGDRLGPRARGGVPRAPARRRRAGRPRRRIVDRRLDRAGDGAAVGLRRPLRRCRRSRGRHRRGGSRRRR